MRYILEKWTKEYFDKIDLSDVPTLNISETDNNVVVTFDDEYLVDFRCSFDDQIYFKGVDADENVTRFGKRLYDIYDIMYAQSKQSDN